MVKLSDIALKDIMPAINEKDLREYKNSGKSTMVAFEEKAIKDLRKMLVDLSERLHK